MIPIRASWVSHVLSRSLEQRVIRSSPSIRTLELAFCRRPKAGSLCRTSVRMRPLEPTLPSGSSDGQLSRVASRDCSIRVVPSLESRRVGVGSQDARLVHEVDDDRRITIAIGRVRDQRTTQ